MPKNLVERVGKGYLYRNLGRTKKDVVGNWPEAHVDVDFCVEALKEALAKHGKPEIFNTDQGSQFTIGTWIDALTDANIQISMDGKGAWRDNRMIERLWRSLKYECVYLNALRQVQKCRLGSANG